MSFSIIGLTETWLDNSNHLSYIEGYISIHNPRCEKVGGGVGIHLSKHLEFKNRGDLAFISDCAESLFIEVNRAKEKNIVVGVIYRPSDKSLNEFISELHQLLSHISKEDKIICLLADWNIHLLSYARHHPSASGEFLKLMFLECFPAYNATNWNNRTQSFTN